MLLIKEHIEREFKELNESERVGWLFCFYVLVFLYFYPNPMPTKRKIQNKKLPQAKIGIFGGSGFYDLLDKKKEIEVKTPYGKPSDKIMVGELSGPPAGQSAAYGGTPLQSQPNRRFLWETRVAPVSRRFEGMSPP